MPGREPPRRGHVRLASPGLGHDLLAGEEAELDADACEADATPADLGARAEIVIAAQLPATHAPAVDFRACSRRASAGDELRAAQGRGRQAAAGPRGLRRTTRVSSVLTCSGRRT